MDIVSKIARVNRGRSDRPVKDVVLTKAEIFRSLESRTLTLEEVIGCEPQAIWMKVHGSRRNDDGSFRVTGRLLNATREIRQTVQGEVSRRTGG
jgi:hypothetical protein